MWPRWGQDGPNVAKMGPDETKMGVEDGPTWIPSGGYVAFQEVNQIQDYVIDIDLLVEKNIISKLEHMMYGLGISNDILRHYNTTGEQLRIEDFT